jgi:hypothetical protein
VCLAFGKKFEALPLRENTERFCAYIESQVASGMAKEKRPDPNYEKGIISGGRWFEDTETKETWRLIPPDFPFRGLFEKVDCL